MSRDDAILLSRLLLLERVRDGAQRDVPLAHDPARLELIRQTRRRHTVSPTHQRTARVPVESVHRRRADDALLSRRRAFVSRLLVHDDVTARDDAFEIVRVRLRRFIDDENVVVDVQRANGVETLASSGVAFARLRARARSTARAFSLGGPGRSVGEG